MGLVLFESFLGDAVHWPAPIMMQPEICVTVMEFMIDEEPAHRVKGCTCMEWRVPSHSMTV